MFGDFESVSQYYQKNFMKYIFSKDFKCVYDFFLSKGETKDVWILSVYIKI